MQELELKLLAWIQLHCTNDFLDAVMPAVSVICDHGEVWLLLTALLLAWKRCRKVGVTVLLALTMDLVVCNGILKPLVARVRPCDLVALQLLVERPADWSFPSGHTAVSFAATAALKASGSRAWLPAFALATLIAFSRLYLHVHWPSDVLAGAVLGTALGFLADRLVKIWESRRKKRRAEGENSCNGGAPGI